MLPCATPSQVYYYEKMEVQNYKNDIILAEACRSDVEQFCSLVEPGGCWARACCAEWFPGPGVGAGTLALPAGSCPILWSLDACNTATHLFMLCHKQARAACTSACATTARS